MIQRLALVLLTSSTSTVLAATGGHLAPQDLTGCQNEIVVKAGDTCESIWRSNALKDIEELLSLNSHLSCDSLLVNMRVCIGAPDYVRLAHCHRRHVIKEGDTCQSIADAYKVTIENFKRINPHVNCEAKLAIHPDQPVCVRGAEGFGDLMENVKDLITSIAFKAPIDYLPELPFLQQPGIQIPILLREIAGKVSDLTSSVTGGGSGAAGSPPQSQPAGGQQQQPTNTPQLPPANQPTEQQTVNSITPSGPSLSQLPPITIPFTDPAPAQPAPAQPAPAQPAPAQPAPAQPAPAQPAPVQPAPAPRPAPAPAPAPATPRSAPQPPASETPIEATTSGIEILDLHNRHRARYGVPPLTWDESLARDSLAYANVLSKNNCKLKHDDGPFGENLAAGWPRDTYASAFRRWTAENLVSVNHHTQILWRTSKFVGCAILNTGTCGVIVCRYTPPGNVQGKIWSSFRK